VFDQGDTFRRMREAGNPFAQPGQVGSPQLYRRQHGEHFVERQAAHRHSS
jgi:hypothetical protein